MNNDPKLAAVLTAATHILDAHTGLLSLIHIGRTFLMTRFPVVGSLSVYLEIEGVERPTTISVQLFDAQHKECGACTFVADAQAPNQGSGLVDVLNYTARTPGEYSLVVCHDAGGLMGSQSIWLTHEPDQSANRD